MILDKNEIMVSVYCLAYNHEQYIKDALDGFVSQKTTFRYEVFVHDDASTDNTASIIMSYAEKYPEIIKPILQKENQHSKGVKILSTFIVPLMRGKYIAACEGDDYWISNNKLQLQVDFLEKHPDYCACVHETLEKNLMTGHERYINGGHVDRDIFFPDVVRGGNTCYQMSSLVYRKEFIFDRPAFFSIAKGYGDYSMAMYLTLIGKVYFFHECMSVYRLFANGSWTSRNAINNEAVIRTRRTDIALLNAVDEYSHYEYSDEIKKVITKKEYDIFKRTDIKDAINSYPATKYYPFYMKRLIDQMKTICKKIIKTGN